MEQAYQLSSSGREGYRNASRSAPVQSGSRRVYRRDVGVVAGPAISAGLPPEVGEVGKRAIDRWSNGPRAKFLSGLRKVTAVPRDAPLWVMLELKTGKCRP